MVRCCVIRGLCFFTLLALVACGTDSQSGAGETGVKAGPGVDLARKVLRLGLLSDYSGPLAAFGKPISTGANMAVERVNAGGSGILPEPSVASTSAVSSAAFLASAIVTSR